MCCNFVVESKVGVNDRKFSSSQRTDRELSDEVGRSLPFSEDGEKVLCSLLLSPRDVLDLCQIKLRPEAFYAPAHQILGFPVCSSSGNLNRRSSLGRG